MDRVNSSIYGSPSRQVLLTTVEKVSFNHTDRKQKCLCGIKIMTVAFVTSMHSSRMRTDHLLTVSRSIPCGGLPHQDPPPPPCKFPWRQTPLEKDSGERLPMQVPRCKPPPPRCRPLLFTQTHLCTFLHGYC